MLFKRVKARFMRFFSQKSGFFFQALKIGDLFQWPPSFEVAFFVFRERVSFLLSAFYKNHCKNE